MMSSSVRLLPGLAMKYCRSKSIQWCVLVYRRKLMLSLQYCWWCRSHWSSFLNFCYERIARMNKWLLMIAVLVLAACSDKPAPDNANAEANAGSQKIVIYNWTEYIPAKVLSAFTKETGIQVEYATYESNEAMYAKIKLLDGKGYDLAVPSTFYVEKMHKEGLLQPVDKSQLTNVDNLDPALMN